jgi:hypothetical protein
MHRSRLLPITLFAIVITMAVVTMTGWSSPAARSACARHSCAAVADPFNSVAAQRWRQCQPHHWRQLVLQH